MTADEIVHALGLQPHPEGGHFRETWRDSAPEGARGHGTAIYYLLKEGESSAWHRVDAVELWHFYAGDPLLLSIVDGDGEREIRLGSDLAAGEHPQVIVPAEAWQRARPLGSYALVGCTVSPAFQFEGFELAPPGFDPTRS